MTMRRCRSLLLLGAGLAAAAVSQAAFEPFVVRDFRVEGAQRIAVGTIYNYVPITLGDTVNEQRVREASRQLFDTGFFEDFEFRRDGDTLVIVVLERPSIEDFTFEGNKDIKDEDLERVLDEAGLARGKIFDRSVLDEVTREMTNQYYGRGKYGARITPTITPLEDNRVRVTMEIEEGDRAKIRQLNIVGNEEYTDKEILGAFELKTGNWMSKFRKNDLYSKEALEGDLETLKSFYMDRGFADFRWDDARVAISPDKRDIYVTVSVVEGDRYTVADVRLAGEMVIPEPELRSLILIRPGQMFSQELLTATEELMKDRLGFDGYAFAEISARPELDIEAKTVAVTFFVDPGNRYYVRRINFNGADSVNDEVLRREMRQLEGAYLSNALVERSKILLQRLPYIEKVEHEVVPVPGSPDLVDVDFEIEEGLPGQFGGSLGYSEAYGLTLGGNFTHANFMGTGNRVEVQLSAGEFQKVYDFNYTDAYRTIDGVTRQLSLTYQDLTQFTSVTSDFSTTTIAAGVDWAYPISEYQRIRFGVSYQDAQLLVSTYSSQQARDWVGQNGNSFPLPNGLLGIDIRNLEISLGWSTDSRNASLFPTAGTRLAFDVNAAVPGSDVEYYTASLNFTKYVQMPGRWLFRIVHETSFGNGFGDTTAQPPYRNHYAGGPGSVRGFKEGTLGPIDSLGNPNGGNLLFTNQFELIVPTPAKFGSSTRIALFFDIGGVFSTDDSRYTDRLGDAIDYDFDYDRLKKSAGLGVEWLAPLGLLRFSYSVPLNEDVETDRFFGDQVEEFQFTIGNAF